jgi:hypothetical protein
MAARHMTSSIRPISHGLFFVSFCKAKNNQINTRKMMNIATVYQNYRINSFSIKSKLHAGIVSTALL